MRTGEGHDQKGSMRVDTIRIHSCRILNRRPYFLDDPFELPTDHQADRTSGGGPDGGGVDFTSFPPY